MLKYTKFEQKHPILFFDNHKDTNVLSIPDLGGYNVDVISYWDCKAEMDQEVPLPWNEKRPSAYWRGLKTGPLYNDKKFPVGRLKLVMESMLNGTAP